MKRLSLFTAILFVMLISTVQAQNESSLKTIMVKLGTDMEAIVRALNYEDFEAIETKAKEIAEHNKPPMAERVKILTFLAEEAGDFKKSDAMVHNSAVKVAEAAAEKDYGKVIENYKVLLSDCVACHTKYRSRIVEDLK